MWSVALGKEVRCFTAMGDQRHGDLEGFDVATMLEAELRKTSHVGSAVDGATPVGDASWDVSARACSAWQACLA